MQRRIKLFAFSILFAVVQVVHALDLPPEAQRDLLVIQLAEHLKHEQWKAAYPLFKRIDSLNHEHGLAPDPTVTYFKGEAAFNLEKYQAAEDALAHYINLAGSKGKYYTKTLQLLAKLDAEINKKADEYNSKGEHYYRLHEVAKGKWRQSFVEALPWFEKAAELGHPSAMTRLAYLYRKGTSDGITRDRKKAVDWYRKGAEKDHIPAIFGLAQMHLLGRGVKKNSQKALVLLQSITEFGQYADFKGESQADYVKAHRLIAQTYLDAKGVERDTDKGVDWLTKVANLDFKAAIQLGDVYANAPLRPGVKTDYTQAAFWYRKAAGEACLKDKSTPCNSNYNARIKLARLYRNGFGVKKDPKWAFELYESANTNGKARLEIALMYKSGEGVAPDTFKAREWFLKTISDSDSRKKTVNKAKFELAMLYEQGLGGEQDYKAAFDLYGELKDVWFYGPKAAYKTAIFYLKGQGVEKDPAKARRHLFSSATKRHYPSMLEYAAMWENGIGGKMSQYIAAQWYEQVARTVPNQFSGLTQEMIDTATEGLERLANYSPKNFLAENKKKPNVHVTARGLQYELLKKGEGGRKPTMNDEVLLHYHGTLMNGNVFKNTVESGKPVKMKLSKMSAGFAEGVMLMSVGDKMRFLIPSHLGYGAKLMVGVPPHSLLIYEVELLEIKQQ
jgi:peptidylprolyl isomerase